MERDEDSQVVGFLAGLICGAAIGAGVALVLAPDTGKKTRRRLQRAATDIRSTATDRWDEVADDVKERVDEALAGAKKRFS